MRLAITSTKKVFLPVDIGWVVNVLDMCRTKPQILSGHRITTIVLRAEPVYPIVNSWADHHSIPVERVPRRVLGIPACEWMISHCHSVLILGDANESDIAGYVFGSPHLVDVFIQDGNEEAIIYMPPLRVLNLDRRC